MVVCAVTERLLITEKISIIFTPERLSARGISNLTGKRLKNFKWPAISDHLFT